MKIQLAKTAGFCMGVKRAMDTALDVAKRSSGPVFTFGPLIHNAQVIAELEAKGIKSVDDISAISSGTVIIRAHGVTPATFDRLKAQIADVVDGTCPLVAKVQSKIKEQADKGYAVVIVGDAGHAEVVGLMGYAGEGGFVVSSDEDIAKLPALDRVAVVSQTTQSEEKFARISGEIKKRYSDCEVFNTICGSTKSRQAETMELAKSADVVVIVGDRKSANTCRLAELAQENCRKAVHVESEDELPREDFAGVKLVAVTAGASTPSWLIERVVRRIQVLGRPALPVLVESALAVGSMFVHANLWAGIGAAALCVTACALLEINPSMWMAALAGLYIFSMHTINRFSDPTWRVCLRPGRSGAGDGC
jgi:(E)-4-hydroxy-3-methyl-but-2-enyl pyrophosphate reductase